MNISLGISSSPPATPNMRPDKPDKNPEYLRPSDKPPRRGSLAVLKWICDLDRRYTSDGFAPAESKADPAPQNDPSREDLDLRDCSLSPRYWLRVHFLRGRMGTSMKAQGTKLQATENDLKRLMADVSRAMDKAQEAITRIAPNLAVTASESKRAHS